MWELRKGGRGEAEEGWGSNSRGRKGERGRNPGRETHPPEPSCGATHAGKRDSCLRRPSQRSHRETTNARGRARRYSFRPPSRRRMQSIRSNPCWMSKYTSIARICWVCLVSFASDCRLGGRCARTRIPLRNSEQRRRWGHREASRSSSSTPYLGKR
jgi:hypothetical protein